MAPIPITIITGFLGSGKTTLILNLIPQLRATNPNYKLALLKNEFGDLAIDSQLASSNAISGVREMLNGCICCNLVGQIGDALKELQDQVTPDRIIIETSGSAFPATLAMEINRIARQTGDYVLDGVVSVIDVENWQGYEDTSVTARLQAKYTDLIVFNKWENCDERRFDDCLDRLGDLETDTAWVKSDKGRVSMDLVFGIDGGLAQTMTEEPVGHSHDHAHDHGRGHQSEVEVLSIELTGPSGSSVNAESLQKLLKTTPKDEVYRIKAVLTTTATLKGSDKDQADPTPHPQNRYILNWAFGRWTFTAVPDEVTEHESSNQKLLRMTMILARHESTKWKTKLEKGGLLELEGEGKGELTVTKIS